MLVLNFLAFQNKKYTADDRFHGNGVYGNGVYDQERTNQITQFSPAI